VPLERDEPKTKISNLSLHTEGRRFCGQRPVLRQLAGLTLDAIEQLPDEHFQEGPLTIGILRNRKGLRNNRLDNVIDPAFPRSGEKSHADQLAAGYQTASGTKDRPN
jgi:hypothetical protein